MRNRPQIKRLTMRCQSLALLVVLETGLVACHGTLADQTSSVGSTTKTELLSVNTDFKDDIGAVECHEVHQTTERDNNRQMSSQAWRALVTFDASGTLGIIHLQRTNEANEPLGESHLWRATYEYSGVDNPKSIDTFTLQTGSNGKFVLTMETGSGNGNAVWHNNRSNTLFTCHNRIVSQTVFYPAKTTSEQNVSYRCFEPTSDRPWALELRIAIPHEHAQGTTSAHQDISFSEVTLHRRNEAPSTRRAQIEASSSKTSEPTNRFTLAISRSEKILLNTSGPVPTAVWQRGSSQTEFLCPTKLAH